MTKKKVDEEEVEEVKEDERDGRGWLSGGSPIRVEDGWGRTPPSSPSRYLLSPSATLLVLGMRRNQRYLRAEDHRHPTLPCGSYSTFTSSHVILASSGTPAAPPGGCPRQVPARDSHGMSGDRYVAPTARISTAERISTAISARTRP